MDVRSAKHGTIELERLYGAPPVRVFAAWAEPAQRARWDVPGRWTIVEQTFDFRAGGCEIKRFGPPGDPRLLATTHYIEVIPEERFVYAYRMTSRDVPVSVSLTTVQLAPMPTIRGPEGTRLRLTEQIALLDGGDTLALREEGLASELDKIAAIL
jgi:uncharacterized protein YndB with AHSA1/START domain